MKQLVLLTLLILTSLLLEAKGQELPANLKWETNSDDPEWSSEKAKPGGTYHGFLLDFPLTFRHVGPESNGEFRKYINGNRMGLVGFHPNTNNVIPALAREWAYSDDYQTVYYRLDPDAKWSDGNPVTVDDFIFSLEFYRSKAILSPWYNHYYGEEYDKVIKYDDHTLAIKSKIKRPKRHLHYYYNLRPIPKHFYRGKIDKDFVRKYNMTVVPTTGSYEIKDVIKGKKILFKKIKDWWAKDKKYYRNRYNVENVEFSIQRDINMAYQYFLKKEIDSFDITSPQFWHIKARGKEYDEGHIQKIWFYVDTPQPDIGFYLNTSKNVFSDIRVRKAFAHALNVDKILSTILRGDYERAMSIGEGTGDYQNKKIRAREFDIKRSIKLLKEAGYTKVDKNGVRLKDDQRLSVTITYDAAHHQNRLLILKEDALKAGFDIRLKLLDPNTAFKSMLSKDHDVAYTIWTPFEYPQYRDQFHSSLAHQTQNNNFTNIADIELDKLIDKYEDEFNETKKEKISRAIQIKIHELAIQVPLWLVPYYREAYWRYWKFPENPAPATRSSSSLFEPFGNGGTFWLSVEEKEKTIQALKEEKKFKPLTIKDETFRKKIGD